MPARASRSSNTTLSPEGITLLARIREVGERGDWQGVKHLFSAYEGQEVPIFTAVMKYAVKNGQLRAAAGTYRRKSNCVLDAPAYNIALTTFIELEKHDVVDELWKEARRVCKLDKQMALTGIQAAAARGDVLRASELLDEMQQKGLQIGVQHITSAIRACWEASGSRHNAAKHLWEFMLQLDVEPSIITFSCLVGAYSSASVEDVSAAYADMKRYGIAADRPFSEICITSVLQKPKDAKWTFDELLSVVFPRTSPARLATARKAMDEFQQAGIELTTLGARIESALRKWEQSNTAK